MGLMGLKRWKKRKGNPLLGLCFLTALIAHTCTHATRIDPALRTGHFVSASPTLDYMNSAQRTFFGLLFKVFFLFFYLATHIQKAIKQRETIPRRENEKENSSLVNQTVRLHPIRKCKRKITPFPRLILFFLSQKKHVLCEKKKSQIILACHSRYNQGTILGAKLTVVIKRIIIEHWK